MKKLHHRAALLLLAALFLLPATASALKVGDEAPPFTVMSTQGEISLADYRGENHVVLALYFAIFTSV